MRYWECACRAQLRLIRGADALAETPRSQDDGLDMHHRFCARCGTRFGPRGTCPSWAAASSWSASARWTISRGRTGRRADLYADGAHDDWARPRRKRVICNALTLLRGALTAAMGAGPPSASRPS